MLRELDISNFRGFSSLKISGLQQLNIITGTNASGKTSILEALYMCAGAGALSASFQLRAFRQLSNKLEVNYEIRNYEGLWEDLFYQADPGKTISIVGKGDDNDSRSVTIFNEHRSSQILSFAQDSPASPSLLSRPQIVSTWKRNNDTPIVVRPTIQAQGLVFDNTPFEHFPVMMFGPHIADTAEETARRFSMMSRSGTDEKVVRALCSEFDFIESLSLEYTSGGPAVYAKLKHQGNKLPLGFISDGVHKLFSLLLGIAISAGGMVLIDQIEDGFFYKKFDSIWKLLYNFAKESNCQLFITSHSTECIQALLPVIRGNESDFSLLYADRTGNLLTVHTVDGRYFEAALDQGLEVR